MSSRIVKAFVYSCDGLRAGVREEAAFRQELLLAAVLVPAAVLLPLALAWKAILVASMLLVLVVELLNSAVEAVVDKASPEQSLLAKRAKDYASAAVLLSLVNLAAVWALALFGLWRAG